MGTRCKIAKKVCVVHGPQGWVVTYQSDRALSISEAGYGELQVRQGEAGERWTAKEAKTVPLLPIGSYTEKSRIIAVFSRHDNQNDAL